MCFQVVARDHPGAAAAALTAALRERRERLAYVVAQQQEAQMAATWEELCFLMRMAAHTLADDGAPPTSPPPHESYRGVAQLRNMFKATAPAFGPPSRHWKLSNRLGGPSQIAYWASGRSGSCGWV